MGKKMNDNEMIKDCIQRYFDGCYESDPEKIKASFNPNASVLVLQSECLNVSVFQSECLDPESECLSS